MEPVVGVSKVSINNKVIFENTGIDNSEDYKGDYHPDNEIGANGVVRFDLDSEITGRHLHIKLYIQRKTQKVAVGLFNTYENNKPQNGRIVFVNSKASEIYQPLKGHYSAFINRGEFEKIDEKIINYLCCRSENYKIISPNRGLLEGLKNADHEWINNGAFLERPVPNLFIAFQIKGNTDSYNRNKILVKQIQVYLENKYKDTLNIICHFDNDGYSKDKKLQPGKNLAEIKSSRYFVFVSDGVDQISYSYFQLSWAMLYVKRIIIISKRDDFSKSLRDLKKIEMVKSIPLKRSIKRDWEEKSGELKNMITEYIDEFLPKNLT